MTSESNTEGEIIYTDDEEQEFIDRRICQTCGTKKVVRWSNRTKKIGCRQDRDKKLMAYCIVCSYNARMAREKEKLPDV